MIVLHLNRQENISHVSQNRHESMSHVEQQQSRLDWMLRQAGDKNKQDTTLAESSSTQPTRPIGQTIIRNMMM